jgi:hypothetical protein
MPESSDLSELKQRLRSDRSFADFTVSQSGKNLVHWSPGLTSQEIAEALDWARALSRPDVADVANSAGQQASGVSVDNKNASAARAVTPTADSPERPTAASLSSFHLQTEDVTRAGAGRPPVSNLHQYRDASSIEYSGRHSGRGNSMPKQRVPEDGWFYKWWRPTPPQECPSGGVAAASIALVLALIVVGALVLDVYVAGSAGGVSEFLVTRDPASRGPTLAALFAASSAGIGAILGLLAAWLPALRPWVPDFSYESYGLPSALLCFGFSFLAFWNEGILISVFLTFLLPIGLFFVGAILIACVAAPLTAGIALGIGVGNLTRRGL